jgi:hypothetical protein
MNKQQHFNACKIFLRKVVRYRRNLLRMNKGKPANTNMLKTLSETEYFLGTIKDFDSMAAYISRESARILISEEIIPVNKYRWKREFHQLIIQARVLQEKKQYEISFH